MERTVSCGSVTCGSNIANDDMSLPKIIILVGYLYDLAGPRVQIVLS